MTDINDLKDKILSAVNVGSTFSKSDLETYLEDHDWDKIANRTEQVYLSLVK